MQRPVGDPRWGYLNGVNDCDGTACRISCGYKWVAQDPAWRTHALPAGRRR